MAEQNPYEWLRDKYPPVISKEQFYRICHVSKRTALAYLEFGLIPCKSTGKQTRKYSIKLADVIAFLEARDNAPCDFLVPPGWYKGKRSVASIRLTPEIRRHLHDEFAALLEPYPDVLCPEQVRSITGYTLSSITRWCRTGRLYHYRIGGKNIVPKLALLEFLDGDGFHGIKVKSPKHLRMIEQAWEATASEEPITNEGGKQNA